MYIVALVTFETHRFAQFDHPLLQVNVWLEVWMGFSPPEELVCEWKLWIILVDNTTTEEQLHHLSHVVLQCEQTGLCRIKILLQILLRLTENF